MIVAGRVVAEVDGRPLRTSLSEEMMASWYILLWFVSEEGFSGRNWGSGTCGEGIVAEHTVVGRAERRSRDCSNHAWAVAKYGILRNPRNQCGKYRSLSGLLKKVQRGK